MVKNEVDFCPLYKDSKKCHDIEYLNCFFCACPYFVFDDNGLKQEKGITIKSKCSISSRKSLKFIYKNTEHCDCSNCTIPHNSKYISAHLKAQLHQHQHI